MITYQTQQLIEQRRIGAEVRIHADLKEDKGHLEHIDADLRHNIADNMGKLDIKIRKSDHLFMAEEFHNTTCFVFTEAQMEELILSVKDDVLKSIEAHVTLRRKL